MSGFAAPLFAAAVVLGVAGIAKATSPDATRVALRSAGLPSARWMARSLGVAEVVIALVAIALGNRVTAALVAASYLGFAWFADRLERRSRGAAPCGCFGASDAPVGRLHVVLNLVVAALAVGASARPPGSVVDAIHHTPAAGAPFLALSALLAYLLYTSLTALPKLAAAAHPPAGATP